MAHNKGCHMKTFTETIRMAAERDGRTAYALAKASGVNVEVIRRFLLDVRGLNLDTAERLCRVLGLELRPVKKKAR